jgi:hypothetical protein
MIGLLPFGFSIGWRRIALPDRFSVGAKGVETALESD